MASGCSKLVLNTPSQPQTLQDGLRHSKWALATLNWPRIHHVYLQALPNWPLSIQSRLPDTLYWPPHISIFRMPQVGLCMPQVGFRTPQVGLRIPQVGLRMPPNGLSIHPVDLRTPQGHPWRLLICQLKVIRGQLGIFQGKLGVSRGKLGVSCFQPRVSKANLECPSRGD